jgi:hypothetical protein
MCLCGAQGLLDVIVADDNAQIKVVRLRILDEAGQGGGGNMGGGGGEDGEEMGAIKAAGGGGDGQVWIRCVLCDMHNQATCDLFSSSALSGTGLCITSWHCSLQVSC